MPDMSALSLGRYAPSGIVCAYQAMYSYLCYNYYMYRIKNSYPLCLQNNTVHCNVCMCLEHFLNQVHARFLKIALCTTSVCVCVRVCVCVCVRAWVYGYMGAYVGAHVSGCVHGHLGECVGGCVSRCMSRCMGGCVCVVCVCVHVHVPPLRLLITSDMIWAPYDWLNKFYSFRVATVVDIVNGYGFSI